MDAKAMQRIDLSHLNLLPPHHTLHIVSSQQRGLFEAALVDYNQKTGIDLTKHTLADRLQDCKSVEDVTAVLCEQAQDFKKFQEKDKVLKPLKKVLTVLYLLSSAPSIAQHVGLVRSKALTDVQRL